MQRPKTSTRPLHGIGGVRFEDNVSMIAPKIMVVEDEEPLGVLLSYNLEAEGYQVEIVTRGDEAESGFRRMSPDLLVLDWMVPAFRASNFAGGCACARKPSACRSSC